MGNDVEQKRKSLLDAYPLSSAWKMKVKKMSEDQVVAVYLRLKGQGRVN